jgi:hypothetical protein
LSSVFCINRTLKADQRTTRNLHADRNALRRGVNASRLFAEIQKRGYAGGVTQVGAVVAA